MINLDGLKMIVSSTAAKGVVGANTQLSFSQRGMRVVARYAGGRVERGWLIGRWRDDVLTFRYAQREGASEIHGGQSVCEVQRLDDGHTRIIEHFCWTTRVGFGTNVFDEIPRSA
jgi:hypothetical protein